MRLFPTRNRLSAFIAGVFFSALITGCGVKAPPAPPEQPPLPAIQNLTVQVDAAGTVHLQWRQPPGGENVAGYLIFKSRTGDADENCGGCPVPFETIGRVERLGAMTSFAFSDAAAAGTTNSYKVVPVYASGARGPDSNVVLIDVPAGQPENQPPGGKGE